MRASFDHGRLRRDCSLNTRPPGVSISISVPPGLAPLSRRRGTRRLRCLRGIKHRPAAILRYACLPAGADALLTLERECNLLERPCVVLVDGQPLCAPALGLHNHSSGVG